MHANSVQNLKPIRNVKIKKIECGFPSGVDDYPDIECVPVETRDDEHIITATKDPECISSLPLHGSWKDRRRGFWERNAQKDTMRRIFRYRKRSLKENTVTTPREVAYPVASSYKKGALAVRWVFHILPAVSHSTLALYQGTYIPKLLPSIVDVLHNQTL